MLAVGIGDSECIVGIDIARLSGLAAMFGGACPVVGAGAVTRFHVAQALENILVARRRRAIIKRVGEVQVLGHALADFVILAQLEGGRAATGLGGFL